MCVCVWLCMCLGFLCTKDQIILRLKYVIRFSVCRCGVSTLFKATHRQNDRLTRKDTNNNLYKATHTHYDELKHKGPIQITLCTKRPIHTHIHTHIMTAQHVKFLYE